jgi:hypothetical protein
MKAKDVKKIFLVGIFLLHKPIITISSTKMIILIIFIKLIFAASSKKRASKQRLTGQNCDESKRCQKINLVGIFCHNCN